MIRKRNLENEMKKNAPDRLQKIIRTPFLTADPFIKIKLLALKYFQQLGIASFLSALLFSWTNLTMKQLFGIKSKIILVPKNKGRSY